MVEYYKWWSNNEVLNFSTNCLVFWSVKIILIIVISYIILIY